MGDLGAQLAACHSGEIGLLALADRYGFEPLVRLIDEVLDYTERRVRSEI